MFSHAFPWCPAASRRDSKPRWKITKRSHRSERSSKFQVQSSKFLKCETKPIENHKYTKGTKAGSFLPNEPISGLGGHRVSEVYTENYETKPICVELTHFPLRLRLCVRTYHYSGTRVHFYQTNPWRWARRFNVRSLRFKVLKITKRTHRIVNPKFQDLRSSQTNDGHKPPLLHALDAPAPNPKPETRNRKQKLPNEPIPLFVPYVCLC